MDAQMLLRSLTKAKCAMSALELTNHWQPTWSLKQVEAMLAELVASQLVTVTHDRHAALYSSTKSVQDWQSLLAPCCPFAESITANKH